MPVQIVDSSEQLASSRQGEPSQEHDFAQEIEQELEQMDTDMEQQELEQDNNLMPQRQEVYLPASLHPYEEQVPSNQQDTEILGHHPEGEMNNISFNESQHRVVKFHRVSTQEDHTSPVQYEE